MLKTREFHSLCCVTSWLLASIPVIHNFKGNTNLSWRVSLYSYSTCLQTSFTVFITFVILLSVSFPSPSPKTLCFLRKRTLPTSTPSTWQGLPMVYSWTFPEETNERGHELPIWCLFDAAFRPWVKHLYGKLIASFYPEKLYSQYNSLENKISCLVQHWVLPHWQRDNAHLSRHYTKAWTRGLRKFSLRVWTMRLF